MINRRISYIILFLMGVTICEAQTDSLYFGQTLPGDSAVIFAPGLISLGGRDEMCIAFSPAGDQLCFTVYNTVQGNKAIFYSRLNGSDWSTPDTAYFSPGDAGGAVTFSPDSQLLTLTYTTNIAEPWKSDLYYCDRVDTGWSDPQLFPDEINSIYREAGHSLTQDGTIYFSSGLDGGNECHVYRSKYINGEYTLPEYIPVLNTGGDEDGVWISPDESYAIVEWWPTNPVDNGKDLYISFRRNDDTWTNLLNMGLKINSSGQEVRGKVTPDGKYLFYVSDRKGDADIYWIKVDEIIAELKEEVINSVNQIEDNKIRLYPNPTRDKISIDFYESVRKAEIHIYNLKGNPIFSENMHNKTTTTIDLTGFSAGMYLIKVVAGGVCYEEKVLKE